MIPTDDSWQKQSHAPSKDSVTPIDSPAFEHIVAHIELPRMKFELSQMMNNYTDGLKIRIAEQIEKAFMEIDVNAEVDRIVPVMLENEIRKEISYAVHEIIVRMTPGIKEAAHNYIAESMPVTDEPDIDKKGAYD